MPIRSPDSPLSAEQSPKAKRPRSTSPDREPSSKKEESRRRRRRRSKSGSADSWARGDENDSPVEERRRPKRSRRSPGPEKRRRRSKSPENDSRKREKGSNKDENDSAAPQEQTGTESSEPKAEEQAPKRKEINPLLTRAGGAYIPPAKLKMMQEQIADKGSEAYQRISWERLKKRIHGLVNRVNVGNLAGIVRDLMKENIIRGKGLLSRSVMQAQTFSPTYSHVYAALVAVINSKFPHIGELILRRLVIQFKRSFRRNDKNVAVTASKFIAHLINQHVVHELMALEILTLLLENPTDDSVEVSIAFLKECGQKMGEVTPRGMNAIFDRLRAILHDSEAGIDKRVQYMIEVLFHIRKDKFSAHPAMIEDLDLLEDSDQITHEMTLEDAQDPENMLNVYKFDPEFEKNEEIYNEIKLEILGDESDDDDEDSGEESAGDEDTPAEKQKLVIIDATEAQLVSFRRTIYLTLQSSLDFQEAAHKILKMELPDEHEPELCHMFVDCCCQQRTYERFYGLLCERFCLLRKEFKDSFESIFKDSYATIHRFEMTKLRNITKLFAHLFCMDAIAWDVLSVIKLNEDDTTSASRICIKILFQEFTESLGLEGTYERIRDPTLQTAFDGIFPRDNPRDTRFAINFFTSIGLGGLTVDLREHLKSGPKQVVNLPHAPEENEVKKEESSSSDSSSSDSSSDSDTSSSDSEAERRRRKQKKKKKEHKKKSSEKGRDKKTSDKRNGRLPLDRPIKQEPETPVVRRDRSPPRRSPPRRREERRSPPRRQRREQSPPRRKQQRSPSPRQEVSPETRQRSPSPPPRRRNSPDARRRDQSPPPRQRRASPEVRRHDQSPPRRSPPPRQRRQEASPERRQRSPSPARRQRSPSPPPRRRNSPEQRRRDQSPPPRHRRQSPEERRRDQSPPLRQRRASPDERKREESPPPRQREERKRSPAPRKRSPPRSYKSPERRASPRRERRRRRSSS